MDNKSHEQFEVVYTEDGTPSLRVRDASGYLEKMHHTAGALGESVYIYLEALKMVARPLPLNVISVGLGLGYNEMLAVAEATKQNRSLKLYSFESQDLLREGFLDWVRGQGTPYAELYNLIAQRISDQHGGINIRQRLADGLDSGFWEVRGRFPDDCVNINNITCVFYDAFSSKMSPELWQEEMMTSVLKSICAPQCVFSTYAATGSLNRTLRALGFKRADRFGYAGKRESTLAIRGGDESFDQ